MKSAAIHGLNVLAFVPQLPDDLAAALAATAAERGVFGARLIYAAEVGSTNDLAAAAAERGAPEGTTFVAGAQTAGRGRLGRTWFSPPGAGLYCRDRPARARSRRGSRWPAASRSPTAFAPRPACRCKSSGRTTSSRSAAPGSARGVRSPAFLPKPSSGPDGVQHVVLGIGINLRPAAFPPELADRAGAIETELGRDVDAGLVLAAGAGALNRTLASNLQRPVRAGARRALAGAVALGARRADRVGRRGRACRGRPRASPRTAPCSLAPRRARADRVR